MAVPVSTTRSEETCSGARSTARLAGTAGSGRPSGDTGCGAFLIQWAWLFSLCSISGRTVNVAASVELGAVEPVADNGNREEPAEGQQSLFSWGKFQAGRNDRAVAKGATALIRLCLPIFCDPNVLPSLCEFLSIRLSWLRVGKTRTASRRNGKLAYLDPPDA